MVTRKNSLPYPQLHTASTTQEASFTPAAGHLSADRSENQLVNGPSRDQPQPHSFMDSDNPWQDQRSPTDSLPTQLPEQSHQFQQQGQRHQREHSLTNIPQALRPGGSGQDTPRSSIDSDDSREWWDDDDAPGGGRSPSRSPARSPVRDVPQSLRPRGLSPSDPNLIPSPSSVKRKPLPTSATVLENAPALQTDFASNNPFRNPSSEAIPQTTAAPHPPTAAPPPVPNTAAWAATDQQAPGGKGKTPLREPNFSASITDFSRMSIHDGHRPDPSAYTQAQTPEEVDDPWKQFESPPVGISTPSTGTAPLQSTHATPYQQPPIPGRHKEHNEQIRNPWTSQDKHGVHPAPAADAPPQIFDQPFPNQGQETGVFAVEPHRPNTSQSRSNAPRTEISLLDDGDDDDATIFPRPTQTTPRRQSEVYAAPPGPPPGHASVQDENPPPKPPRPSIKTTPLSEAQIAKNAEQRNETYQIKHFNWFDHGSGRLRRSSMLTQNQNGPCPLLALVNALILGARDESQAALDDALRSREQVSLGLIVETLMYELVERSATGGDRLPDVDELNAFLIRLRTGMNANPRFVPTPEPAPNIMDARNSILHMPQERRAQLKVGTFEATGDIKLYGAFSIPLVHGWIPEVGSDAARAFARSAQTYEDAQAIQFGEEELEYKLARGGLSPDEQRIWEDITSIKSFFQMHPTQLTATGLENIQQSLSSGSFAIMFRNDHFSTIYKHPQSGMLYTLITDAGYADRDEIIWESLVDISGSTNEFFSGDFMPVSHHQGANSSGTGQHLAVDESAGSGPLSPQQQQEQHDADFAMALQLQEEEEQRQRAEQARRRRSAQSNNQQVPSPRGSTGNIPIVLTRSRQSQSDAPENRPAVPPRRQGPPAVNRPADANDDDAPPAYEEAAKGRPYIPPVGSPLHPTSGPTSDSISPMSSSAQLTGTVSNSATSNSIHPPGPNAPYYGSTSGGPNAQRPAHGRIPSNVSSGRLSAYQESTPTQPQMPGSWSGRPNPGSYQATPVESTGRRRRGDCVVM